MRFSFVIFLTLFVSSTVNAQNYEPPVVILNSRDLPQKLTRGRLHRVQPKIQNNGYQNTYRITSKVGNFSAIGLPQLEQRVAEIYMIALLQDRYRSTQIASDAAVDTATELVTDPIKGAQKAIETATDSEKLEDTVRKIPKGIINLFTAVGETIGHVTTTAYNAGSSVLKKNSSNNEKSNHAQKAVDWLSETTLDYVGYNKRFRSLAQEIKADPFTTNQILRKELRRVAGLETGVRFAGKWAPALYGIPYVGTFNRYFNYAQKVGAYEDPQKLRELNTKVTKALAKIGRFGSKNGELLLKNKHYSPLMHKRILDAVKSIKSVKDFGYLLKIAGTANNREQASHYMYAILALAQSNKKKPLRSVIPSIELVSGITRDNTVVIQLPFDYLRWTKKIASTTQKTLKEIITNYKVSHIELYIAGRVSKKFREEILKKGDVELHTREGYL